MCSYSLNDLYLIKGQFFPFGVIFVASEFLKP